MEAQRKPLGSGVKMDAVVKSVGRVFDVLELFSQRRGPMNASEICAALDYPSSSGNALLKSFVRLGYLSFDTHNRSYFPSVRVTQLGHWIPQHVIGKATLDILDEVSAKTGETVTLSIQNDLEMQFIRVVQGTHPIALNLNEGFQCSLFGSAVGTALLAALDESHVERLIARARREPDVRPKRGVLVQARAEIDDCRKRGIAIAYDRLFPDTGAVATLLPASITGQPMVLGVGGLASRMRKHEAKIVRAMRSTVRRAEALH